MTLVESLDYASVFVFALTGALTASRAQLDLVGFAFVASITAVGGGTARDVLLNRDPVFWIGEPTFLALPLVAAVLVFFTAHLLESRLKAILWFDALALAVAVPAGMGVAQALGQPVVVVILMAMATGTLGGLMRDVVCNEVPMVLRQGELYVTAAFAGAVAGIVAARFGLDPSLSIVLTGAVTFLLRAGSLLFGWRLPVYKARPPRA